VRERGTHGWRIRHDGFCRDVCAPRHVDPSTAFCPCPRSERHSRNRTSHRNSPNVSTRCFLKRSESNPSRDGRAIPRDAGGQVMQMNEALARAHTSGEKTSRRMRHPRWPEARCPQTSEHEYKVGLPGCPFSTRQRTPSYLREPPDEQRRVARKSRRLAEKRESALTPDRARLPLNEGTRI